MNTIFKNIKHIFRIIDLMLLERKTADGVTYIYKNKSSKNLILIFDGIGGDYNYKKSLKQSSYDQLFIKDSWAKGVSYYLFENGENTPEVIVSKFIDTFLREHKYSKVVTLGSSKGGSSALYFGLKHKVDEVYAGACQFLVGNYIGIFHEKKGSGYYKNVMGSIEQTDGVDILNNTFNRMIEQSANTKTLVHLIYSTEEHTYTDDIIPLKNKLDEYQITHTDKIENFQEHSMIGNVMKTVCKKEFK